MHKIRIMPRKLDLEVPDGVNLLTVLRSSGILMDAPCGGQGKCGKCLVQIDGRWVKACSIQVQTDMTVILGERKELHILKQEECRCAEEALLAAAFDIGTTSVVCSIVGIESGNVLACEAAANPQAIFGADVVSRIRAALAGDLNTMTDQVRNCMSLLLAAACARISVNPARIRRVAVVGNPAMQQLFLGISPENLVQIPFLPVLTNAWIDTCGEKLPICENAELMTVPDISGYVGADTMGCILATGMFREEQMTLLVDIGTNGEMVLGNRHRMIACATAAGPALEGANIRFGMRACPGAIDHVWLEDDSIRYSTIGGTDAIGICGSGLIDAVAVFLKQGKLNARGRIVSGAEYEGERILPLTERIYLTQDDIRQVQLAKGAIRAGIQLMVREMGVSLQSLDQCLLAGAFGSFINVENACAIGLLPPSVSHKFHAVGNTAMEGANLVAANPHMLRLTDVLVKRTEYLELAALDDFAGVFARAMRFDA